MRGGGAPTAMSNRRQRGMPKVVILLLVAVFSCAVLYQVNSGHHQEAPQPSPSSGLPVNVVPGDEGKEEPQLTSTLATEVSPAARKESAGGVSRSGPRSSAGATVGGDRRSTGSPGGGGSSGAIDRPADLEDISTLSSFPQCVALGPKFNRYLETYLTSANKQGESSGGLPSRLIYNCESDRWGRFCGGMGDRFRGMISTFFLALVTNRRFELFHPRPVPIQQLLSPRYFSWVPKENAEQLDKLVPVDTSLMQLKKHKKFMKWLAGQPQTKDLRLQSNSFSVDPYLYAVPMFKERLQKEMGLSPKCNMTAYFSCLFHVLFRPAETLKEAMDEVVRDASQRMGISADQLRMPHPRPYIGVQIRVGGSWASGLRIKEPFRTPPATLPHFYEVIDELRKGLVDPQLKDAPIFVSSDAKRLIDEFLQRYGNRSVFFVPGDAYQHTDTGDLGKVKPQKYQDDDEKKIFNSYLNTLLCHMFLGESQHMVMAQSGFGDTAFWKTRRNASCIFVDMNNNRLAWQHQLVYPESGGGPSGTKAVKNRIIDINQKPKAFYH